jgi:hypothetical protein
MKRDLELYEDARATVLYLKENCKESLTEQELRDLVYRLSVIHELPLGECEVDTFVINLKGVLNVNLEGNAKRDCK